MRSYNVVIDELRFEWDDDKDALNRAKHQMSFREARTVFFDPHALVIDDPDHSASEERFIILGHYRAAQAAGCGALLPAGRDGDPDHLGQGSD
jgi:hypothetical protein